MLPAARQFRKPGGGRADQPLRDAGAAISGLLTHDRPDERKRAEMVHGLLAASSSL